ncbi:restriction endonuclease [Streptomyces sp. NPDC096205]|uniref:restriction endonuclease n=1 Tax=Streptomyces sp. NPDC096205 TaxID=3366081 RepID=UPI0037F75980
MTTPARRIRRTGARRFDLRATAVYFGILALVLCAAGLAVRMVLDAVQGQPVWAAALGLVALSCTLALRRRRRRRRDLAAGAVQQAAAALEAGRDTALAALEPPGPAVPRQYAPRDGDGDGDGDDHLGSARPEDQAWGVIDYDALDADEFEQAVAALCARDGCTGVEVVGGAGDLGADVLAVTPDGRRLVVQCKRYGDEHRVGSQDLQRFGGTCYTVHEADVAALVTTSDFTAPAVEYAEQCGILCLDRAALQAWSDGTGPAPWPAVSTGTS